MLRPFPRIDPTDPNRAKFQRTYREEMIAHAGFAVFIAGNRDGHAVAPGVIEEYEISKEFRKIPIPIAVTGSAALEIWNRIRPERDKVYSGLVSEDHFNSLNDPALDDLQLLAAVFKIIDCVSKN